MGRVCSRVPSYVEHGPGVKVQLKPWSWLLTSIGQHDWCDRHYEHTCIQIHCTDITTDITTVHDYSSSEVHIIHAYTTNKYAFEAATCLDLPSVPGYDPASLLGWRLSCGYLAGKTSPWLGECGASTKLLLQNRLRREFLVTWASDVAFVRCMLRSGATDFCITKQSLFCVEKDMNFDLVKLIAK